MVSNQPAGGPMDPDSLALRREKVSDHLEAVAAALVRYVDNGCDRDVAAEMRTHIGAVQEAAINAAWESVAFLAYHTETLLEALCRGKINADSQVLHLLHDAVEAIAVVVIDPGETKLVEDLLLRFADVLRDVGSEENADARRHPSRKAST